MQILKHQQEQQEALRFAAGSAWNNRDQLVFTNELGEHLTHLTVYQRRKGVGGELPAHALSACSMLYSASASLAQNLCSMVAASARVALPPGTSLPSLPPTTPFITIQLTASVAQSDTSPASGKSS